MQHLTKRGAAFETRFGALLLSAQLLVVASPALAQQAATTATPADAEALLERDKPVSGQIEPGQTLRHGLFLVAGQYLWIIVEQRGATISASLIGPDERKLVDAQNDARISDSEEIYFIAQTTGPHRVELRSEAGNAVAKYEVRLEELRAATAEDRSRAAAAAALAQADRLTDNLSNRNPDALRAALRKYEEALTLWRSARDSNGEAATLGLIARTHDGLNEGEKALEYHRKALAIREALGDRAAQARSLNDIGASFHEMWSLPEAIEAHSRALTLAREVGDSEDEGEALNDLGVIYAQMGESRKAIDAYARALEILRAKGDRKHQAPVLHNIAASYETVGETQKALDTYYEVLALARAVGERYSEAAILGNLGRAFRHLGEPLKALDFFEQALALRRALGDRRGEAYVLARIGDTHLSLEAFPKALDCYRRALSLARETSGRIEEAGALAGIARVQEATGEKTKALEGYEQALSIYRATRANRSGEVTTLALIGEARAALGNHREAREALEQALRLARASELPGEEIRALSDLARIERDDGDLAAARDHVDGSLQIVEKMRTSVSSSELRSTFLSSMRPAAELHIDVLMRLHKREPSAGYDALALEASERSRARSLLDLLYESGVEIRRGVDPQLLEREKSLRERIAAKAELHARLLRGLALEARAQALAREIADLKSQHEQVQSRIRATSPRYASLTQPQPLTANEIQNALPPDTLLLEYWLGEEKTVLWAIDAAGLRSYELASRSEIERTARSLCEALQRPDGERGAGQERNRAAARLSDVVLRPAAASLGKKRLIIVAEGALQLIPFAALPEPGDSETATHSPPLLVAHEVISLPSASVLAALRHQESARRPAPKTLLVFADPVFEKNDARVRGRLASGRADRASLSIGQDIRNSVGNLALARSVRDIELSDGDFRLGRLPFTRVEANGILGLVPVSERRAALDFDASREVMASDDLSTFRFVHFATHGFANTIHPELSGLVLSLVDRDGKDRDGFLPAMEVFNLSLNADLVVLSACRTALGKEIRGEGLVGLTRAFMYAGAPRVVASLWRVDDAATAELMKRFYRGMLGSKKLRPAAALREAQLAISKQGRWEHPYYWAGFVLQGEWR